jgi:hypothetical protein
MDQFTFSLNTVMAFNCDQCDASYSVRMSLSNHKILKHGDAKQFACQHCEYMTINIMNNILDLSMRKLKRYVKYVEKTSLISLILIKFHPETLQNMNKRKSEDPLENESKRVKFYTPKASDTKATGALSNEIKPGDREQTTYQNLQMRCEVSDK